MSRQMYEECNSSLLSPFVSLYALWHLSLQVRTPGPSYLPSYTNWLFLSYEIFSQVITGFPCTGSSNAHPTWQNFQPPRILTIFFVLLPFYKRNRLPIASALHKGCLFFAASQHCGGTTTVSFPLAQGVSPELSQGTQLLTKPFLHCRAVQCFSLLHKWILKFLCLYNEYGQIHAIIFTSVSIKSAWLFAAVQETRIKVCLMFAKLDQSSLRKLINEPSVQATSKVLQN